MDWLEKMNRAISYIEDNLADTIDFDEVARNACCSTYHFQRMFSFIVDLPLSEYIRRRRLTLAAFELQNSNIKVIDLALKYGYESPDAFTRAFQNLHGVTPTLARDMGVQLKAYPRISFQISIRGDVEMNYKVEEKDGFSVFGIETIIDTEKCNKQVPEFWLKSIKDGSIERIKTAVSDSVEPVKRREIMVNAVTYGHSKDGTHHYMICQYIPETGAPDEFVKLSIPSLTWAIFPTDEHAEDETTGKVQAVWNRIYSEWFPTSGYEHKNAPEFEMYYKTSENKYFEEIWIPVIKK